MIANGIEAKVAGAIAGHDGEACFYGSLYYDGKKVGTWQDGTWGGPRDVLLKNGLKESDFDKRIKGFYKEVGLMKDPAHPSSIPAEEADFMKGKYLDPFIDFCVEEKTAFKTPPTKAAKQASKNGMEGVSLVFVNFKHFDDPKGQPFFERRLDGFTKMAYQPLTQSKDMLKAVDAEGKAAKEEGQGIFVIRRDGTAESLKAFQKRLRSNAKAESNGRA